MANELGQTKTRVKEKKEEKKEEKKANCESIIYDSEEHNQLLMDHFLENLFNQL